MPDATPDEVLLAAVDVARGALLEITPAETIGEPIGHIVEGEHLLSLLFESKLPGYPGWRWTVSLSRVEGDEEPAVLETELMPGETALIAPDWVPWSERLADYRAAQEAAAEPAGGEQGEPDGDDLDDDPDDFDGDDEFDGIDIDELDGDGELDEGSAAADLDDDEADDAE